MCRNHISRLKKICSQLSTVKRHKRYDLCENMLKTKIKHSGTTPIAKITKLTGVAFFTK